MLLWVQQADVSVEPRCLSLWLPSFSDHFCRTFQEAILALRVLNMLDMYINSLGKNLALNLFVHSNAHCTLGDVVDASRFTAVTSVGHSF